MLCSTIPFRPKPVGDVLRLRLCPLRGPSRLSQAGCLMMLGSLVLVPGCPIKAHPATAHPALATLGGRPRRARRLVGSRSLLAAILVATSVAILLATSVAILLATSVAILLATSVAILLVTFFAVPVAIP